MNYREIFLNMINENINEMSDTINCLYITSNSCVKNKLLNRLRKNISNLFILVQGLQKGENISSPQMDEKVFTEAELSRYNGKDGNPAYVAVNGIVYDVTNVASWGGATHFGLTPGRDVTSEFASCHAGQPVLSKLKVVGKMVG